MACSSPRDKARADSSLALVSQQRALLGKLSAERDSVSQTLADANLFIGRIDSSISRVKGLGREPREESAPRAVSRISSALARTCSAASTRSSSARVSTARQVTALKQHQPTLLAKTEARRREQRAEGFDRRRRDSASRRLMSSIEQQAQTIALLQAPHR